MKEFIRSMFSSSKTGAVSSKRVCAFIMLLVVCFIVVYNSIKCIAIPETVTHMIVAILVLLGCESVCNVFNIFKKE